MSSSANLCKHKIAAPLNNDSNHDLNRNLIKMSSTTLKSLNAPTQITLASASDKL